MAFFIHKADPGAIPPFEYLPCSAITPKAGMALIQSSGKLAVATGTSKPTYISMVEKSAAVTAGELIPVIKVDPSIIFETTNSASLADVSVGAKVTLHASSGMQVTATTTSGVATIVEKLGDSIGSKVRVRFE